jgi:division protein CdvB (Snf7/Vps24/ESCRT-III family)
MNNIELLEKISRKIDRVRDEINDLTLKVVADENYDLVFDSIVSMISDLENVSSEARVLADEIDTIEI